MKEKREKTCYKLKSVECNNCSGTGIYEVSDRKGTCSKCGGEGEYVVRVCDNNDCYNGVF